MKVAILTLPLNDNFGGILQAYALRQTLVSKGHEVVHVEKKEIGSIVHWVPFRFYTWWYGRRVIRLLLGRNDVKTAKNKQLYNLWHRTKDIREFVHKNIPRLLVDDFQELKNMGFECIVVGSDQVWRPIYYGNIEESYLNFTENWTVKRVAYAPSFGAETWEYSPIQTRECKRLLEQFDVVSSREDDGVQFCQEKFGIECVQVLDPTMLLTVEDYKNLISKDIATVKGQLTTYILDDEAEKKAIMDELKKKGNYNLRMLVLADKSNSNFQELSISKWLEEFIKADFVFTDSFHGCVFAILLHKPFIVYGNKERGMSRFRSLLRLFKLEDRLIYNSEQVGEVFAKPIDWKSVDLILKEERVRSSFLFSEVGL